MGILPRVVLRGRLGQGGERRRLGDVQLAGRLAEIALGGGLDTVGTVAEVDLVQIELEDLVLGIVLLDLQRDPDFAELALDAQVLAVEVLGPEVAGQLHGDGGAALRLPAGDGADDVAPDRAGEPEPVDPVMLVEALVLGDQEGRHDRRD